MKLDVAVLEMKQAGDDVRLRLGVTEPPSEGNGRTELSVTFHNVKDIDTENGIVVTTKDGAPIVVQLLIPAACFGQI